MLPFIDAAIETTIDFSEKTITAKLFADKASFVGHAYTSLIIYVKYRQVVHSLAREKIQGCCKIGKTTRAGGSAEVEGLDEVESLAMVIRRRTVAGGRPRAGVNRR